MCSKFKNIWPDWFIDIPFLKEGVILSSINWKYTEAARTSTYVFDVDVNLFTEDARVACAAVSRSVSLKRIYINNKRCYLLIHSWTVKGDLQNLQSIVLLIVLREI